MGLNVPWLERMGQLGKATAAACAFNGDSETESDDDEAGRSSDCSEEVSGEENDQPQCPMCGESWFDDGTKLHNVCDACEREDGSCPWGGCDACT